MRFRLLLLIAVFAFSAAYSWAQAPATEAPPQPQADAKEKKPAKAEIEKKSESLYLRVKRGENNQPVALQTAIVRYKGKPNTKYAGRVVDLVGVVHIGQKEYYQDLNKRLSKYDSVLYELVAPDGTRIRPEDLKKRR